MQSSKKRIAVFIPAFKEDSIITDTVRKAYNHNYPKEFFKVIVIADSLQQETLENLRNMPVQILEVGFDISTKAKSINAALQLFKNDYFDIAVILDADNVMGEDCLEKINDAFHKGCKAVQCHRKAKNVNNPIALLDAISEEINTNLFRRGPAAIGLSAAPAGSGMALEFRLFKDIFTLDHILSNAGEDREIDIQLMIRNVRMEFIDNAYVYDEKVTSPKDFEKQRIRWLEAQMNHIKRFFQPDIKNVPKTSLFYNKLFQNLIVPRLLYLILFITIIVIFVLQQLLHINVLYPLNEWWLAWMLAYSLVLFISIPPGFFTLKTLRALLHIPVLMMSMLKAILKMKRNRKEFLHTSKSFTTK